MVAKAEEETRLMHSTSLESLQEEDRLQERPTAPSRVPLAFLLILCAIHVVFNGWWLQADNHTIRTDEEGHMLLARTYYETIFLNDYPGPVQRVIALSHIEPGNPAHPPFFHVAGATMIALFGYSTDTIALTNTVFFVVLLLGCFALARTFLDRWQSLFVTFVVSMTPVVFAASRFFMTDYGTAALVVWAVVALVRSEGLHRSNWVFLFGLLSGLGILTRTVTVGYLVAPALLAALIGFVRCRRRRGDTTVDRPALGSYLVNMVMALTVCVGVFAPWYYTNLEPFYDYWSNKEIGNRRGPLTNFVPPTPPVPDALPEGSAEPSTPTVVAPEPVRPSALSYAMAQIKEPDVAWIRYPVYLVNNGLFTPLAALAVLGMVLAFLRKQNRVPTLLYLYAWILGSWFFFTVILRSGTPRYGLPVAPALAFFAALFVLALPGRWFREGVMVLVAAVLIFQFGNLTVLSYGALSEWTLPAPVLAKESRHFIDEGLVIYKDNLTLSNAYGRLAPPRSDNYKEQFFDIMMAHEKTLPVREGAYANFQKLGLRGMPLYEKHYWPGDGPYRLDSLAPDEIPERRLRLIHMGLEPEHLLALLPETDYILYQTEAANPEKAKAWEAYFGERGFAPVATFEVPAFGWVPARINGVLARKLEGELVEVSAASIPTMNLYDLHELSESADFDRLSPEMQALVRSQFETALGEIATPYPLSESVTFMAASVGKTGETSFRFRLVFRVESAMDRDWRMLFHGFVAPEDVSKLPPEKQEQGYIDFNFDPQPPTSLWEAGRYVVLSHTIHTTPMVYQFKFGFFSGSEQFGQSALLNPMDLSAVE